MKPGKLQWGMSFLWIICVVKCYCEGRRECLDCVRKSKCVHTLIGGIISLNYSWPQPTFSRVLLRQQRE